MTEKVLADLGEDRILREMIYSRFKPHLRGITNIGDDCVFIPAEKIDQTLVVSTDPCPWPVINTLEEPDYYANGWLSVAISVSDLAAAGARPIGIMLAIDMPPKMKISDFSRFLDGVEAAALRWNCPVVGGNIRDQKAFHCVGTVLGHAPRDKLLCRTGSRTGDLLAVAGVMGSFLGGSSEPCETLKIDPATKNVP